jgi:hypothetical protein
MRKLDFVIVLVVVAMISALTAAWRQSASTTTPSPSPLEVVAPRVVATPSPAMMLTSSGHWRVVPCKYSLAMMHLGMTFQEVMAQRGHPSIVEPEIRNTQVWRYDSGLKMTFMEGRMLGLEATGRWDFREGSRELPGFMHSQAEIQAVFGKPTRKNGDTWYYQDGAWMLTFEFSGDRCQVVQITTQVQRVSIQKPS